MDMAKLRNVRLTQYLILSKLPQHDEFTWREVTDHLVEFSNEPKQLRELMYRGYIEKTRGGRPHANVYRMTERGREIVDVANDYLGWE